MMTFPASFAMFALVIVVGSTFVSVGANRISRLDIRAKMVVAGVWFAIHVAAFRSGIDGLWVGNALVVGSAANVAALVVRTVRTPGSLVVSARDPTVPWPSSLHRRRRS